jgi:hypothetical protein
MRNRLKPKHLGLFLTVFGLLAPSFAQAGVFNIPHFVAPDEFAVGVEPEVIFSNGGGVGVNGRFTQGLSDVNNITGIIGTGSGPRNFRLGGALTFDLFPDVEKQPGIGVALEGLFVQLPTTGSFEVTGTPYIHKTFQTAMGTPIDPFFALPTGLSLAQGQYQVISTAVVGAMLQYDAHFRTILELGVNLSNANSYISGGVVYYH